MTTILAIDPGNEESAYTIIDADTQRPILFDKIANDQLLKILRLGTKEFAVDHVAIEMIESYGMAVGKEVFETCVWIGRFAEAIHHGYWPRRVVALTPRGIVKMHHCHSRAAKDGNIIQALVDRYASGVSNRGKGGKANPGWFYGFKADIWQAYALAVYTADTLGHTRPAAN